MGIQGLIPFLKKASRRVNVKEFSGCTVGVDAYCWLHKGAFGCAEKLGKGQDTDGYVKYCIKIINVLISMKITPIMVFDGRRLPAKEGVERNRREQRDKNKRKAKEYLREGKLREAREYFQRSVDITSEMALELIKACQRIGVDCIVAPYEADAQLAYLNKMKIIQLVITEDSDLVLFGCDYILFKMDSMGFGVLVEKTRLHLCMDVNPAIFLFEKFRYMCIMSGCDYLPSLPGIGLVKSCKFFNSVTNLDLKHTLSRIPSYLRMPQLTVSEEYKEGFIRANNTYLHQLAFDPQLKKLVPLNPYPDGVLASDFKYAGPYFSNEIAYQLALGNVNVCTMQMVANFDPSRDLVITKTWNDKSSKLMEIRSIWSADFKANSFDMAKSPIEVVYTTPTKGKEVVIKTPVFTQISRKRIEKVDVEENDETLAKLYSFSPAKKKSKIEFSPEKLNNSRSTALSEKEILDQILCVNKKSPKNDRSKVQNTIKEQITSKYFKSEKKEETKISWFEQIANEYEQKSQVEATNNSSDKESESEDLLLITTKEEENNSDKEIDEPITPKNFTWKGILNSNTTNSYLASTSVINTPFKSPNFVRKFSLTSSQSSANSSLLNTSMDNDSFNLSQTQNSDLGEETSQKSFPDLELEELETPPKKPSLLERLKNKTNFEKKLTGGTCRQTGLRKSNKQTTNTRQLRITDTLNKFQFSQSRSSFTHS